jgi:hypothetical protein
MEIQGTLKQILPLESGESKSGKAWQKQTIIVETQETYPKLIAIEVNEKAISRLQDYQIGHIITCSINIESREYNGKYFTSVKAWKI